MSKKSHHFLTLWPWPLTYDLEKLIRSGHYHYQCVYQIWEQSIPWFLSYRVNTIAGGGRLRRKTITSPDPSDTGDIIRDYTHKRHSIPHPHGWAMECQLWWILRKRTALWHRTVSFLMEGKGYTSHIDSTMAAHEQWWSGPVFCLSLGVSSGCAPPITGQVTSVTWPVIGWA